MTTPLVQQIKSTFDESGITAAVAALNRYNKAVAAANESTKKINTFGAAAAKSFKRIGQIASGIVVSRGLLAIGQTFTDGIASAAKFEKAISEISTIARESGRDFEGLADGVREISDALGLDILEVAEAEYQVLSNQVVDAADSFEFLNTAARLATATVSSNASSVSALSSVLNSFRLPASSAKEVADKLFKTVELGRVRMDELGNILGRVTPLSASLGISFGETTSAIAALTQVGIKAAEATTLLSNVQLKLIKPTDTLKKSVQGLGAANAQVLISAFGFEGALQQIAGTTAGTAEEFGKLFGRVRALRGALSLSTDRAEDFRDVLEKVGDTTGETLDEAFDKVFKTNAKQVEVEINKIKNLFTVDFGRGFINVIAQISDGLGGASGAFQKFSVTVAATGVAMGIMQVNFTAVAAQTIPTLIKAMGAARLAMVSFTASIPLLAAVAGISALVTTFLELRKLSAEQTEQVKKDQAEQLKANITAATKNAQIRREATQENIGDLQVLLIAQERIAAGSAEIARGIADIGLGGLTDQVQDRIQGFESLITSLRDAGIEAREIFLGIRDLTRDVKTQVEDVKFENRLDDLTKEEKIIATIGRAEEKAAASRKAALAGDKERAAFLESQALSLGRQATSQAQGLDNALERQVEARGITLIEGQIKGAEALAKGLEARSKKQEKLAGQLREELNILEQRAKLLKPLAGEDAAVFDSKDSAEEVRAAFGDAGIELQKSFTTLGEKVKKGFRDNLLPASAVAELTAKFENTLTGASGNIANIFNSQFEALIQSANAGVQNLSPELKALLGQADIKLSLDLSGIELQLVSLLQRIESASALTDEFEAAQTRFPATLEKIRQLSLDAQQDIFQQDAGADVFDRLKIVQETVSALQQTDVKLIKTEDIDKVLGQINGLENVIATSGAKGIDKFKGQFSSALKTLGGDFAAIIAGEGAQIDLQQTQNLIQNFTTLKKDQIQASKAILSNAKLTTAETKEQLKNAQAAALLRSGTKFFGGSVLRANGGAVGQDSVNVKASPGEGFLTAKAMRSFFPQVQAMNSGRQPIQRAQGGSVTTVHGDTNITIKESGTPQATLRELTRGLNRQSRTKTGKIR